MMRVDMDGNMMFLVILFIIGICSDVVVGEYKAPHCDGNRHGIVHLFEWRWEDIANECKDFLGPYGFCGVQTSPANENRIVTSPNRPWWERYQPVSYKLETRSGNEEAFKNMVNTCNEHGVRIFVDVVMNHMTGAGGSGYGTGGSSFDATNLQFPGVPYGPTDFNGDSSCHTGDGNIHDYKNANEVRNCRLVSLLDLQLGKEYVRGKVSGYMNHLVDLGVAGFRLDAAKHMWPGDITAIIKRIKDVSQGGKPFVFQEVIDQGGEPIKGEEYLSSGRITNFKFGLKLAEVFRKKNAMKWLSNWGSGWGMWSSGDVVNFIDNHDNQRGGGAVLTHNEAKQYKMATAFMLAHPYGIARIMSSFNFNSDTDGPPHNADMSIKPVAFDGFVCKDGWVCEHRWRQIYNMVAFRNMAQNTPVMNWWSGADYQIAFSRGSNAFIAFNLEDYDLDQTLQTGLPGGTYCDVISGNFENGACTGSSIQVGGDGRAKIHVCSNCDDPMAAYHTGARVGSTAKRY